MHQIDSNLTSVTAQVTMKKTSEKYGDSMRVSAYDLAFMYCSQYAPTDVELTPEFRKQIVSLVYTRLVEGWLAEDLIAAFEKRPGSIPRKGNLLDPRQMYYHNQLRLFPGPPRTTVDYNTGEIVRVSEPYFLEMRASFTVEDAVEYYRNQFGLRSINLAKAAGTFRHLLKTHDVDHLLFMIDCCANERVADDMGAPVDPIRVGDYFQAAEQNRFAKITEERQAGVEAIVPRRRVLMDRSGGGRSDLPPGVPA